MPIALLREVASTFDRAIVSDPGRRPDVALARKQHDGYARVLADAGFDVEMIPTDDDHPDSVFIEDTAVIVGSIAVVTRPGATERRGEVGPVAEALQKKLPLARIEAPGTLDGGDVMIVGGRVYVGRSQRTNDAGIDQLETIASSQEMDVTTVPVREVLHLKSAVLPVSDTTVVVTPDTVDEQLLSELTLVHEASHERHKFSAVRLGSNKVLVTASAPDTADLLAEAGITTIPIDVSEIQAADGGLTCLSIVYSARTTQ